MPGLTQYVGDVICVADQVPPVLAASAGGEGLRPLVGEVSLRGVQPGVRDEAVHSEAQKGKPDDGAEMSSCTAS